MTEPLRVAIIGAGASGLAAIKACLDENLYPVCFEMGSDIGGLWNYTSDLIEGRVSVSKSTVTNTSKEISAFSNFPMPIDFPNYLHHDKFLEYYRLYAQTFDLTSKIKFNCKVTKVTPTLDYETSGQWEIRYNENSTDIFDAVMVCTGILWKPYEPFYKGLNDKKFTGEVIHGWKYRDSTGFEGKRVLIIGMGNSGCDIGVDLSQVASQVYMSVNNGLWCATRLGPYGLPSDTNMSRFNQQLGKIFPTLFQNMIKKRLNTRFDHELYGLRPPQDVFVKRLTVNDELPVCILKGDVKIKPKIVEFFDKKCVFEDGSVIDDIDFVVLATGYDVSIPFLNDKKVVNFKNGFINLYKSVFPPDLKHSSLAFIGFVGNRSALNSVFELQSRWAVGVFNKRIKLPNLKTMNNDILVKINAAPKFTAPKRKQVFFEHGLRYTDELAEQIGCKPNIIKYFFINPKLWYHIYFGPPTPYQYRLNGPNCDYKNAKDLIYSQNKR
jgi:dimethylaniline monooxygenase (N-oxide forming)